MVDQHHIHKLYGHHNLVCLFDNFDVGDSSAADAFIYTIATNKVNVIRFLSPAKDLIGRNSRW